MKVLSNLILAMFVTIMLFIMLTDTGFNIAVNIVNTVIAVVRNINI